MNGALILLGVAVAGAAGSLLRHEVIVWAGPPASIDRARGVAVVNLVGALLLGLVGAASLSDAWTVVLGFGFCGSLTTFSTWTVEAVRGREAGRSAWSVVVVDLVAQVVVGVGLVLVAWRALT